MCNWHVFVLESLDNRPTQLRLAFLSIKLGMIAMPFASVENAQTLQELPKSTEFNGFHLCNCRDVKYPVF